MYLVVGTEHTSMDKVFNEPANGNSLFVSGIHTSPIRVEWSAKYETGVTPNP